MSVKPIPHGGKILVVDDLADWRAMVGGLLQDAGYAVSTASNEDDAMRLLRQEPFHVAIVDLRLDEQDEYDRSGLALAARMKQFMPELAIVILTGKADLRSAIEALQPSEDGSTIAFDYIEKHEIAKLLARIGVAFEQAAQVNPNLNVAFEGDLQWNGLIDQLDCLRSLSREDAQQEIGDLLQRIFNRVDRVMLSAMQTGESGSMVLLASPRNQDIPQADVVIKLDQREKTARESSNYDNYVAEYISSNRRTYRLDHRSTARVGGIVYSFVGGKPREFRQFGEVYAEAGIETIMSVLENLFLETCHTWYTSTRKSNGHNTSLGSNYLNWLKLDNQKLERGLTDLVGTNKDSTLVFETPKRPKHSPLLLSDGRIVLPNPLPISGLPFGYTKEFCFTHGDMNEQNILIDSHGQTWLIDFYHTGPAHPVRDAAMLESVVKFYLQRSSTSLTALHQWERLLLQVDSLAAEPAAPLFTDPELNKAFSTVICVRRLLNKTLPSMTWRDYQISLFFHALKSMTLAKKLNRQQRQHALVSASLLVDQLSNAS